jgi:hypothetical protein
MSQQQHPLCVAMENGCSNQSSRSSKRSRSTLERRRTKKRRDDSETNSNTSASSNAPSSFQSPDPRSPPVEVWTHGSTGSTKDPSQSVVKTYVADHLIHMVKFIDKQTQLQYSTTDKLSICYTVLTGCKCVVAGIDRSDWWNTKGSVWVYHTTNTQRNNKMSLLKLAFCGK